MLYAETATNDLAAIIAYIAARSDPDTAYRYAERIDRRTAILTSFPHTGNPREDLGPGIRTIAFERRATIAYRIDGDSIIVVRILYAGRAWDNP
ncbi:type II toxin-antitoxin system RelE/ParE family toxin [Sandaracinobacteroides saxicola]|uniref:Type II toxin-antitoxin system RelE/ParE family toxin n=1 Tax=Sandaracinobacteroides saxicola TaxID=2759707 RepID=A0A7G5IMP2_9SPHN|nr:type II toxin-antitoxin system RelE/ParE family toxin [Sandaracinobacteroides saxicola]